MWQDNYNPYQQKKPWWSSRPTLLIGAVAIMGLGIFILWNIISSSDTSSTDDVPYIMADQNPEKVKPEHAGGEVFPHQDKKIYDLIDGDSGKITATVNAIDNADQQIEMPITDVPSSFTEATALTPEPEQGKTVYNIQGNTVNLTEINDNDAVDNKKSVITTTKEDEAAEPYKPVLKGPYRLQVASLSSKDEANEEIKTLNHKFKMLKSYKLSVSTAQVDGKTVYRIHAGPLESKEKAESLCQDLQSAGGNCLVTKSSKA